MAETPKTPAEMMREASDVEAARWRMIRSGRLWDVARTNDNGTISIRASNLSNYDASRKLEELKSCEGMRAALRALAAEFQDQVVKNAILWAASKGEDQV